MFEEWQNYSCYSPIYLVCYLRASFVQATRTRYSTIGQWHVNPGLKKSFGILELFINALNCYVVTPCELWLHPSLASLNISKHVVFRNLWHTTLVNRMTSVKNSIKGVLSSLPYLFYHINYIVKCQTTLHLQVFFSQKTKSVIFHHEF